MDCLRLPKGRGGQFVSSPCSGWTKDLPPSTYTEEHYMGGWVQAWTDGSASTECLWAGLIEGRWYDSDDFPGTSAAGGEEHLLESICCSRQGRREREKIEREWEREDGERVSKTKCDWTCCYVHSYVQYLSSFISPCWWVVEDMLQLSKCNNLPTTASLDPLLLPQGPLLHNHEIGKPVYGRKPTSIHGSSKIYTTHVEMLYKWGCTMYFKVKDYSMAYCIHFKKKMSSLSFGLGWRTAIV